MQIHVAHAGQKMGPYSIEEVRQRLSEGSFAPSDLAWHEGITDWVPLSSLVQTPDRVAPPPLPPGKQTPAGGRKGLSWVTISLLGCGGLLLIGILAVVGIFAWLASGPNGGVKLRNEMEAYATQYLEKHKVLEPQEEVVAYYDETISMDGTEAAILTNKRVVYHKDGKSQSISIGEISNITHRYESLVGDVIEVTGKTGDVIKIEIAPMNQGETFKNVLMDRWEKSKQPASASGS